MQGIPALEKPGGLKEWREKIDKAEMGHGMNWLFDAGSSAAYIF